MERARKSLLANREPAQSFRDPARVVSVSVMSVIWAWVAVVVLHAIPIGGYWDDVAPRTWAVILAWLAAFAATAIALKGLSKRPPAANPAPHNNRWISTWLTALCGLSVVGAALIVFEFAVIRNYGFAAAAAAIRAEETTSLMQSASQGSVISGLGRLILPAFLVACVMVTRFWKDISIQTRAMFLLSTAFVIYEQLFFEGGRFFMTMAFLSALVTYLLMPRPVLSKEVAKRRLQFMVRFGAGAVLMLWFFTYVFVERVLERDGYLWSAYLMFTTNFELTPNYSSAPLSEGPMGPAWFSATMLWIYVTQGINEFDLLLSTRYFEHAYGLYQVPHVAQALDILFGIDIRYDVVRNLPTLGSYATFLGHNFVDFGVAGTVVSGAVLAFVIVRTVQPFSSSVGGRMAYMAPFAVILGIFSPIVSLVPNLWPAMAWALIVGWSEELFASGHSGRREPVRLAEGFGK